MHIRDLNTDIYLLKFLSENTKEEIIELIESIRSCGQAVTDATDIATLQKALAHPSLSKHATDIYKCKEEIRKAIALKIYNK